MIKVARVTAAFVGAATCVVALQNDRATAADIPQRPVYAPPAAVVAYNWTGIYGGLNAGYAFGQSKPMSLFSDSFTAFDYDANGWLGGLTGGAQIQSGRTVLGLEADIAWADINGSATGSVLFNGGVIGTATLSSKLSSISTLRARVGYAADNWLFYGTGGLAITNEKSTLTGPVGFACGTGAAASPPCSSITDLHLGLAAGGGLEYGITPNLSSKLEYLWVGAGAGNTLNASIVRVGINWRFGM